MKHLIDTKRKETPSEKTKMSKIANDFLLNEIKEIVLQNSNVKGLNSLKTRQFGSKFYVELEIAVDENITVSTTGTGNNGKYYTDWRLYQSGNGNAIVSAKAGQKSWGLCWRCCQ